jgi:diguanylate cyclase (GGDEF)-like protein
MDTSRILIIDDDSGLRKTLADILRAKGYDILTARSGAEGLAMLVDHAVNLALIDLGLPDMPGLEVLDTLKAGYPSIEAIILTGNATLDSAIEATNREAFSFLVKPYDIDTLLLQIRRAIEKQQARERITRDSIMLQNKNITLKVLYSVSQAISKTMDIGELIPEVLRTLAETEIFTFEIKGVISLIEGEKIRMASFINIAESELEPCNDIRPGECLCRRAMATGEIMIARNCSVDSRHPMCNPAVQPHGHIIVPLKAAGVVVGMLNLYIQPETEVTDEIVGLLTSVASQVGIAISNARLYEETRNSSLHDPLTGLANRRFMEIQLDKSLEAAKRYQEALSFIMVDIDHFKNYNDCHGHQLGDRLLGRLAGILLREVRKADYVFRFGGEEFLVVLPETALQDTFRCFSECQDEVGCSHHDQAENSEGLAADDQLHGDFRLKDTGIIGELVPDRPEGRGEDIAHQESQNDLPVTHCPLLQQGAGGCHSRRQFRDHLQGDDAHGLGRQARDVGQVTGHRLLHFAEVADSVHDENDNVDRDGEEEDLADAFFKPQPALFQGSPPVDARFCRRRRDRFLSERDRQQETADHDDRRRPQQGGQEGQADVDERRSLDQRHGDEKHRRQMDKIGWQAVEQIGQDQLFPADLLLVVSLCEQGVGRYPGKHRKRKGGAGDIGKVAESDQRPGQQGNLARPVQGLDEIGDKQAERQHADQPEQGPEQPVPEHQEGIGGKGHKMKSAPLRFAEAVGRWI